MGHDYSFMQPPLSWNDYFEGVDTRGLAKEVEEGCRYFWSKPHR